jgi:hypothetical protein
VEQGFSSLPREVQQQIVLVRHVSLPAVPEHRSPIHVEEVPITHAFHAQQEHSSLLVALDRVLRVQLPALLVLIWLEIAVLQAHPNVFLAQLLGTVQLVSI